MPAPALLLLAAPPALAAAVAAIGARHMATTLIDAETNLDDDIEIVADLHAAGFGSAAILALMGSARRIARRRLDKARAN